MIELYPAIDLRGGHVVRLRQGDYADETVYGDDPVAVAQSFADAGATWIHIVDLDAAKSGDPVNRPIIQSVARAVRSDARVQTGGGVRSLGDARQLADSGVARAPWARPRCRIRALVEDASAVVPGRGRPRPPQLGRSPSTDGPKAAELQLDRCLRTVPDSGRVRGHRHRTRRHARRPQRRGAGHRWSAEVAGAPVIASGGVADLADIERLAKIDGLGGIITGKALYEGRFTVAEALGVLEGSR